ncbi:hypothetical protein [Lyngbya sp. PCC 8106]|uniref:hypothetical protein n=1 Tax=Lyngbya sp. (strain PCC 8106) TaxID=313612 RepID=UPI0000EA9E74|nr:hypothetical protein [Lyngbya sp. PCC 8106]EAW38921.1 hypothetical protein L8106_01362 [Lyngbya sp. PCC 8106]
MPECPRCHQPVDSQALACPHCKFQLKAFGHPGIPLHRATQETYLCSSCLYHEDDTCNFPQRPYAKECTLYHDRSEPILPPPPVKSSPQGLGAIKYWVKNNGVWLVLLGLLAVSLLLSVL